MAYLVGNPKTKKAAKELVAKGEAVPYQPTLGSIPKDGTVVLEGPHYPDAHTWYATGTMKDGKLVKIR